MSSKELETLILEQNRVALRWDNEPGQFGIEALDEGKIRQFLERAGLPWDNTANTLQKLDLLNNGQSFLEIDLADLLDGQRYAEFANVWRLLHANRVPQARLIWRLCYAGRPVCPAHCPVRPPLLTPPPA